VQGHNGMVAGLAFTQDAARLASLGSSERLLEECSFNFGSVIPACEGKKLSLHHDELLDVKTCKDSIYRLWV